MSLLMQALAVPETEATGDQRLKANDRCEREAFPASHLNMMLPCQQCWGTDENETVRSEPF
jgi:hypothetical protein